MIKSVEKLSHLGLVLTKRQETGELVDARTVYITSLILRPPLWMIGCVACLYKNLDPCYMRTPCPKTNIPFQIEELDPRLESPSNN